MNSEEQAEYIGNCWECDLPVYKIGGKVQFRPCSYGGVCRVVDDVTYGIATSSAFVFRYY